MWLSHGQVHACPSVLHPLTRQSQHHRHPSPTQGRTDPASWVEPRPMTGSLVCFRTRIRWSTVLLLLVVHKYPLARNPSHGRPPSTLACQWWLRLNNQRCRDQCALSCCLFSSLLVWGVGWNRVQIGGNVNFVGGGRERGREGMGRSRNVLKRTPPWQLDCG